MKYFIITILSFLLLSCSSSTEPGESFNGKWEIVLDGGAYTSEIKTTSKTMDFLGITYSGKYVGDNDEHFTGNYSQGITYYSLTITLSDGKLQGYVSVKVEGISGYNQRWFTGTRQ